MKALQIEASVPRYLIARALGAAYKPVYWSPLGLLRYRDVPDPTPPGPDWAVVQTRYGGICGSDMHAVSLRVSPALSALVALPITLGHENTGVISEAGDGVGELAAGDRVVIDPPLPCAPRGVDPPCRYCLQGQYSLCMNLTKGVLSPGVALGSCRDVGGSWSPLYLAHRSQLFRVPDAVNDENALMTEPFSVALHAVAPVLPEEARTVLILGAGTIGLCVVAALRSLGSGSRVMVLAKYPYQGEMARRYGADQVFYLGEEDYLAGIAEATGATLHRPILGERVAVGGADLVFECVGSSSSIDDSLRLAASGGTVVLVGQAGVPRGVDWSPIWLNEIAIRGCNTSGTEITGARRVRTMALALEILASGKLDLEPMLTHRFPLANYKEALSLTAARSQSRMVKSVFAFD